jgi:hypothetical protein
MIGYTKLIGATSFSFHLGSLFDIFLFLLSVMLYLKILDLIFFPYILRLHFYLSRQDNWYTKLHDFGRVRGYMILHDLFSDLSDIFPKEFILKENTSKYPLLLNIFYTVSLSIVNYLCNNISRFVYYLPHSLLVISIVYDLYHSTFQYMYYFLLLYFITNIIKKVRKFFYEKDCVYDDVINKYFYEDNVTYKKIHEMLLEKEDMISFYASSTDIINWKISRIMGNLEELVNYFKVGLKVYYIVDPERKNTEKHLLSKARRLNILFLLLIVNMFFIHAGNKYKITLSITEYEIQPISFLIPIFIITVICDILILYDFENTMGGKERKMIKNIFFVLTIMQTIIILYIMLKNHIILKPNEFIINYEYIKIIENFTVEEKIAYIKRYIDILIPDLLKLEEYKTMLKEKMITLIQNSKSEVTLESLRNIVDNDIQSKIRNV